MSNSRRDFIKNAGMGLLAFNLAGGIMYLTPAEARRRGINYQVLQRHEVALLEALGDTLVPGSKDNGIAHFIDHQLSGTDRETKLAVRYLGLDISYPEFYQQGSKALDNATRSLFNSPFSSLDENKKVEIVRQLMKNKLSSWDGPPAPKFYYAVKSDAVDVVYGTLQGIERLGIPYMAHIYPPNDWGQ